MLVTSLKQKNMGSKVLLDEEDEWVEEVESSDEEVKGNDVCLMETTDVSFTEESKSITNTFEANIQKATSNSIAHNWDS